MSLRKKVEFQHRKWTKMNDRIGQYVKLIFNQSKKNFYCYKKRHADFGSP